MSIITHQLAKLKTSRQLPERKYKFKELKLERSPKASAQVRIIPFLLSFCLPSRKPTLH
uniref:Uncharacterized protein n=1 Tax=Rhizophora mucronata TaxID=61149 RepID=A0A2P2PCG2_RHIMU